MSQNQATTCAECGTLTSITHRGLCFNCILVKREAEQKAKAKAYRQTPETKAKKKAYQQTPERKAKAKAKYYESRKRRLTPQW